MATGCCSFEELPVLEEEEELLSTVDNALWCPKGNDASRNEMSIVVLSQ